MPGNPGGAGVAPGPPGPPMAGGTPPGGRDMHAMMESMRARQGQMGGMAQLVAPDRIAHRRPGAAARRPRAPIRRARALVPTRGACRRGSAAPGSARGQVGRSLQGPEREPRAPRLHGLLTGKRPGGERPELLLSQPDPLPTMKEYGPRPIRSDRRTVRRGVFLHKGLARMRLQFGKASSAALLAAGLVAAYWVAGPRTARRIGRSGRAS